MAILARVRVKEKDRSLDVNGTLAINGIAAEHNASRKWSDVETQWEGKDP